MWRTMADHAWAGTSFRDRRPAARLLVGEVHARIPEQLRATLGPEAVLFAALEDEFVDGFMRELPDA